ncbi:hypothetical protein SAMN06296952_2609 [Oscillospiraceae bacterium]|nr:hypothetical protein SAMN06296952_2609 [Oscillospiraceae bacterium]
MSESIDVTKIMEEIRDNIKTSGADQIPLSFADQKIVEKVRSDDKIEEAVRYISYNFEVQPYQMLEGNPAKVFVKKCIRKLASFFFLPIVGQQNALNQQYLYVAETVLEQREQIALLKEELARLERVVDSREGK